MKIISTALLSFGLSGRAFHAPFILAHPGFELAGAWERNEKRLKQSYPSGKSFETIEEILDDQSIELVVINTPTFTHYEYAFRALEAGKNIIVEKAFTTSVAEAKSLRSLAEKQGKMLAVYQNRRWDSDFLTVQQFVESKFLGEIVDAEIRFERFKPELSPKRHKEEPNPGAGLLMDLGPHIIDQALVLFGMPESLKADLRITRPGSQVDDWFDINLYYPGLKVRLKSSLMEKVPGSAYNIKGTKGSFLKSRADVQEADLLKGLMPGIPGWGEEPDCEKGLLSYSAEGKSVQQKVDSIKGNYMEFYNGIYSALTENVAVPVTADDGIHVMTLIEAARASDMSGKIVNLEASSKRDSSR
ncbi:MAG: Gfo/Idh/MocA family oxidoreductase [Bacteroidetes bacterium]|nr:Gfo/Idh/MocA family oxidoreductase [Bacteroidota bacterium]